MKTFVALILACMWLIAQIAAVTYFCDHSTSCGCSRNDAVLNRIVGGESAVYSSWNWIVSLRAYTGDHICGATIVSPRYIITAAHCVSDPVPVYRGMSVAVGMNLLSESATVGEVQNVQRILPHPDYNPRTHANDIAILRLARPLDLSSAAATARLCLPYTDALSDVQMYPPNASPLVAIGWGTLSFGGESGPDRLHQVTVNEVDPDDFTCRSSIYNSKYHFCAGVPGGGKDTCQGDSGGPLMRFEPAARQWVLAGVTSYGTGCGRPDYAGVYTRVTNYMEWIRNNIGDDDLLEIDVGVTGNRTTTTTTTTSTTTTTTMSTTRTSAEPIWTTPWDTENGSSLRDASKWFTFFFLLFAFSSLF